MGDNTANEVGETVESANSVAALENEGDVRRAQIRRAEPVSGRRTGQRTFQSILTLTFTPQKVLKRLALPSERSEPPVEETGGHVVESQIVKTFFQPTIRILRRKSNGRILLRHRDLLARREAPCGSGQDNHDSVSRAFT